MSRYIGAIQRKDFKTVIDLTQTYQQGVARLKAANPQSLWPKVLSEYYKTNESALTLPEGGRAGATETLWEMSITPVEAIRSLQVWLPAGCKWTITESRTENVRGDFLYGTYNRTRVFVTVDYPPEHSPFVAQKLIKQTVLEFSVNATSQQVVNVSEVREGRVYWVDGPPNIQVAIVKRLLEAGILNNSIDQLDLLERQGKLTSEGKHLLAQAYYRVAEQRCMTPYTGRERDCRPFILRAGEIDSSIPELWGAKLLALSKESLSAQMRSLYSARDKNFANTESLLKSAVEFITNNAQLRAEADNLKRDLARQYVLQAMGTYSLDAFGRVGGEDRARQFVSKASDLNPNVLRDPLFIEAVKEKFRMITVGAANRNVIQQYEVTSAFGFMVAFQVPIPRKDLPDFLNWTKYATEPRAAGGPTKWERALAGLASD